MLLLLLLLAAPWGCWCVALRRRAATAVGG
jgi:hypothetical protein